VPVRRTLAVNSALRKDGPTLGPRAQKGIIPTGRGIQSPEGMNSGRPLLGLRTKKLPKTRGSMEKRSRMERRLSAHRSKVRE